MNKFWKWMEDERGYSKCRFGLWNKLNAYEDREKIIPILVEPTKQMLIGYMIEYLFEIGNGFEKRNYFMDANDLYEALEKEIKKYERKIKRLQKKIT